MARQQEQEAGHREGSRWINAKPSGTELAEWFAENVKMHDGLSHADYLPGITLIPNKEKVRIYKLADNGSPTFPEVEQLVYTPYPKVETRIAYFWDLMALHASEWSGAIRLIAGEPQKNLPAGFFHVPVEIESRYTHFIGVSYQIEITDRRGRPVIDPPAGTKIVPLVKTGYSGRIFADENAIHKAQTGAIGRALGFAGMLVVPGAGIATAEDMQEFLSAGGTEPTLPPPTPPPAENGATHASSLQELVAGLTARLESDFPAAYDEAVAWAAEKGYALNDPPPEALRGLERLLRKKVETAEKAAAAQAQA